MKNNHIDVFAEMACSHEGQVRLAKKIIDGAGNAGADAVQLQIWSLAHMMSPKRTEYDMLKRIELKKEEWRELVNYSRNRFPNMDVFTFLYEHVSIDFTESLDLDGYKLSSSDLSNPYMLDKVAATGKQINLSVGASTLEEIRKAIHRVKTKSKSKIILMYGIQNFPTSLEEINLNYMMKLKDEFGLPIGYQDHCDAQFADAFRIPALAAGMGVAVLEKHITHDRSFKGIDHESALNPDEFKDFVNMVRKLECAKGSSQERPFSQNELKYRKFQKKSITAARDIPRGTVLQVSDLLFLRAEELGISPDNYEFLVNRTTKCDINAFQIIREEDLN